MRSTLILVLRTLRIAFAFAVIPLRFVGRLLTYEGTPDRTLKEHWWGEMLAHALESLGASFVKFGQILGSRPDLLPPGVIAALARLQDNVKPVPYMELEPILRQAWGTSRDVIDVNPVPLAAASVAQVHEGRMADGTRIAIKIQRPLAREQIERDLVLMRLGAALLDRIPSVHLLSLPGSVQHFGDALAAQLDFRVEAANNARFRQNFAQGKPPSGTPGRERSAKQHRQKIRFPEIIAALSSERVLTMVFVEGVKATDAEAAFVGMSPAKRLEARAELAERGGRAILKMVFEDGFVHADLHPGNILLGDDGVMTFLDLGLVAEIPGDIMRPWVDTFTALAQRDGKRAAELFYGYAPSESVTDYAAYERGVSAHLETLYGVLLSDMEVSAAVGGMLNVLREHRVQVDPVFTVVNVALLVAEGLGKQLDPRVDLVLLAVPFLLSAQLTAPPGRAMLRQPPARA